MEPLIRTPKPRSKSSVKIINKRSEISEGTYMETPKTQSYKRVYGHFPTVKRIKSTRDYKTIQSPSRVASMSKGKMGKSTVNLIKIDKKTGKTSENEKIRYEILKAKSDKLELMRDLSTYEHNLYVGLGYSKKIEKFIKIGKGLEGKLWEYEEGNKKNLEILSGIDAVLKGFEKKSGGDLQELGFFEVFGVRPSETPEKMLENYQGMHSISGISCCISITSKFSNTHMVKCLLLSGQVVELTIHKQFPNTLLNFSSKVKEFILPSLYFLISRERYSLLFDKTHGKSFLAITLKLKGLSQTITLIINNLQDFFRCEIAQTKFSILIDKFDLDCKDFSAENLLKQLKNHLFFNQNSLVWGDDPFNIRERSSKMLKDNFLSDAFNDYLRKVFEIKIAVGGKTFKVEGFECQKKKHIKVISSKSTVILQENSQDFKFLFMLQHFSFGKAPKTLTNSLELREMIKNLMKADG